MVYLHNKYERQEIRAKIKRRREKLMNDHGLSRYRADKLLILEDIKQELLDSVENLFTYEILSGPELRYTDMIDERFKKEALDIIDGDDFRDIYGGSQ